LYWGPEDAEGCSYDRVYLFEGESKRVNYSINGFIKEFEIKPKIYSNIEVISR